MKPIEFKEQNMIYQKPESMTDEQCSPLPVHKCSEGIISCWELTPEERQKVLSTGVIWFCVMSPVHPPIWLDVESPFESQKEPDSRPICPDCNAVMVKTHIELEDHSGWFTGWGCECEYEPEPE